MHEPAEPLDPGAAHDVRGCPTCGRPGLLDARFCAGCGHRFLGEDDELEPEAPTADPAILEPIAELDLVLRVDERHLGRQTTYDVGGVGQGEASPPAPAVARQTCFVISADPSHETTSDADARWSLRLVAGGS